MNISENNIKQKYLYIVWRCIVKKTNNIGEARGIGGFMSGVLVLSLSTILVKIIGLAVKIPLLRTLGAEGMGYFNSAVEIYALLCVISTAGLPVALSMLISESRERGNSKEVRRVYKGGLSLFLIIGAAGSAVMLLFSEQIANLIGNSGAKLCILAISPAVLLICFSSAVRGYFQGFENMTPTAISQLIEAIGKLLFGVGFGVIALKMGAELQVAAAMSVLGLTLGILLSSIYLTVVKLFDSYELTKGVTSGDTQRGVMGALLKIALPITVSSAILSLCRIIDMSLILHRLQEAGMSASDTNRIYGSYTTLAVPVFALVPSLITPISLSLVPRLSSAIERGDTELQAEVADRSQRLTVLLALPASMGIALYSTPILSLLFSGQDEAVALSAPLLSVLGISVVFSGMITTTNAILQSYRLTVKPIVSMAIGSAIKLILAFFLIGIPEIGVYGAPISTLACNIVITIINLYFLGQRLPVSAKNSGMWQTFMRPFGASVCAIALSYGAFLWGMYITQSDRISFLIALPVALASYCLFALLFGAVREEDMEDIPLWNIVRSVIDKIRKKQKIK